MVSGQRQWELCMHQRELGLLCSFVVGVHRYCLGQGHTDRFLNISLSFKQSFSRFNFTVYTSFQ